MSAVKVRRTPPRIGRNLFRLDLGSQRGHGRARRKLAARESDAQLIARLGDTGWYNDRYVADYAADALKASSSPEARLALAKYFEARQEDP